ncbi:MAG: hypothetical protein M3Y19_05210, partial [Actinomycetota bacterium]|nr:hypothetical protein [Actinomycetota bacterium]
MTAPGIEPTAPVPLTRPHRVIPVHVDTLPIEDGHTAAPVVGAVGSYVLGFREVPDDEPDALARAYRVRAEPLDTTPPSRGKDWSGRVRDDPPMWRIQLHGDGWSARWLTPRPAVGHLELRGTITGEWSYGVPTLTRGRITRARMVTETYERTGGGVPDWRRVASAQALRELGTGPLRFDHGLVPGPRGAHGVGRAMVAPDPWTRETGVLVDLDLDDVPPYARRPAIVPGGLAAHGRELWVADVRLPLLVHLRDGVVVDEITWRGVILTPEQALHQGRTLHADASGCWIVGPDGVHRADHDG